LLGCNGACSVAGARADLVAALVGMGGVRPLRIRPHYTCVRAAVTAAPSGGR